MKGIKQSKEMTDEEYWEQFTKIVDEEGERLQNHDLSLDITCKFRGLNGGVVFETKEPQINCNMEDLKTFFENLKKTIRMVDESIGDKEVGDGF